MLNVVSELDRLANSVGKNVAIRIPVRKKGNFITGKAISFREFAQEVDTAVKNLKKMGVNERSRVLLLVAPGKELLLATFALLKMGAIPIVIDPGMGIKNFLTCVKNSSPQFLLGNTKAVWISYLFYYVFRSIHKINIKKLLRQSGENTSSIDTTFLAPEETAAILFTSGSTGAPKGVCYTHRHFYAQLQIIRETFNILPGEIDFPLLPVFALFNPALGMSTVVPEMDARRPAELNPAYAVESINIFKVTNSFGSPRLWTKIADYCEKTNKLLPSLKRVLIAGAPASPRLLKRIQALIVNGDVYTPYGATEALPLTIISAREVLEDTLPLTLKGRGTCVGRPLSSVEIKILPMQGADIKAALPNFEIGEIVVSGPIVTEKYDNAPKANAAHKIWVDGRCWHRMGDLGYRDEKGRLWFCGRKAERVVIDKSVWYTECCEPIFNVHPNVFRSALIHLKTKENDVPAIVVEPINFPCTKAARKSFQNELRSLALSQSTTQEIEHFFFYKKFPVDVRHNAKIHRLTLGRYFSKK